MVEIPHLDDTRHVFVVSVTVQGSRADYKSDPMVVTERAYNLHDAVRQAAERPLRDWFADAITQERNEDHERAVKALGDALLATTNEEGA